MNYSEATKKNITSQNTSTIKTHINDKYHNTTITNKPYYSNIYNEHPSYPIPPLPREYFPVNKTYCEEKNENISDIEHNKPIVDTELKETDIPETLPILTLQSIPNKPGHYKLFDNQIEQIYSDNLTRLKEESKYYDNYIKGQKEVIEAQLSVLNQQQAKITEQNNIITYNTDFITKQQQSVNTYHTILVQQSTQIQNHEQKVKQLETIAHQINNHIQQQNQMYQQYMSHLEQQNNMYYEQQQQQQQQQQMFSLQPPLSPSYQFPSYQFPVELFNAMTQTLASMVNPEEQYQTN